MKVHFEMEVLAGYEFPFQVNLTLYLGVFDFVAR